MKDTKDMKQNKFQDNQFKNDYQDSQCAIDDSTQTDKRQNKVNNSSKQNKKQKC